MFPRLLTSRFSRQKFKDFKNLVLKIENLRFYNHCGNLTFYIRTSKNFRGEEMRTFSTDPTGKVETPNEKSFELDRNDWEEEETLNRQKIFEEIAQNDPEVMKKLKLLEFEIAVLKEEQYKVPDKLLKRNWVELLELRTVNKRRKYLSFLRLNELKSLKNKIKSQKRNEIIIKEKEELGFHYYGLSGQTMFLRIYKKDLNTMLKIRQMQADFRIIFDCSYEQYMSFVNIKNCAKQLLYCANESKIHPYPSQLEFFNVNRNDNFGKSLPFYITKFYEGSAGEVHSGSYLDKYPKEKLVYLSPHAPNDLGSINLDNIYIVGAFVDKGTGEKVSLAKAKEQNLKMARFPLDKYVQWKVGVKSLPLNIVTTVLLDMAFYNNWTRAFKNLSKRKLEEIDFHKND